MERDTLLAHGTAHFLRERLFKMSDPYACHMCSKCGHIASNLEKCVMCGETNIPLVNVPYAAKLLFQELQAMLLRVNTIPEK
jgi:DNA-directed RNA polymerase beta subunit